MSEELIRGYDAALDTVKIDLSEWETKCEALKILSDKIEQVRADIDRNELLDIRQKLNDLKSQHERCNKLVKGCIEWANHAILVRLEEEGLDNYTRAGLMFYPSVQNYTSVADRVALEAYVKETGTLEIFGNGLSKDVVESIIESTGDLPPGVSTYRKTRLNVRSR